MPVPWTFPNEIFKIIIESRYLQGSDLKSIRLVHHVLNEFATPILFENAAVSVSAETLAVLQSLSSQPHLSQHVKNLDVDGTFYFPLINPNRYAKITARHFQKLLGNKTPDAFSEANLKLVLTHPNPTSVSPHCLDGELKQDFLHGYVCYQVRSKLCNTMPEEWSDVYSKLTAALPRFPHLNRVTFFGDWVYSNRPDLLIRYLHQRGIQFPSCVDFGMDMGSEDDGDGVSMSPRPQLYLGPGRNARDHNPLHLPPAAPSGATMQIGPSWPTHVPDVFRSLFVTKTCVRHFSVPPGVLVGSDEASDGMLLQRDIGMSMTVFTRGIDQPKQFATYTFSNLRTLELIVDVTRGDEYDSYITSVETTVLPPALRSMREIRRLTLVFHTSIASPLVPFTLRDVFRTGSNNPVSGNPENEVDTIITFFDANDLASAYPPPPSVWTPDGFLVAPTNDGSGPGDSEDHSPAHRKYRIGVLATALKPNPWPFLEYLRLSGLNSAPTDLMILLRTMGPSLRDLHLHNINLCHHGDRTGWPQVLNGMCRFLPNLRSCAFALTLADQYVLIGHQLAGGRIYRGGGGGSVLEEAMSNFLLRKPEARNPFRGIGFVPFI